MDRAINNYDKTINTILCYRLSYEILGHVDHIVNNKEHTFNVLVAECNISIIGVFSRISNAFKRNLGFRLNSLFLILENPDSLGLRKSVFLILKVGIQKP